MVKNCFSEIFLLLIICKTWFFRSKFSYFFLFLKERSRSSFMFLRTSLKLSWHVLEIRVRKDNIADWNYFDQIFENFTLSQLIIVSVSMIVDNDDFISYYIISFYLWWNTRRKSLICVFLPFLFLFCPLFLFFSSFNHLVFFSLYCV